MSETGTEHRIPAVERYLQEVAAAGSHLPVGELHEIVSSIRDHIDDELGGEPAQPSQVAEVLAELGPADRVIAAPEAVIQGPRTRPSASIIGVAVALLGIVGVLVYLPLGVVLCLAAVIIGVVGRRRGESLGVVAMVLGVFGVVLAAVALLFFYAASDGDSGTGKVTPAPVEQRAP